MDVADETAGQGKHVRGLLEDDISPAKGPRWPRSGAASRDYTHGDILYVIYILLICCALPGDS